MVNLYLLKGEKSLKNQYLVTLINDKFDTTFTEADIKKNAYGKAYIEKAPNFSVSHVKDNIFIALSNTEVGVDAEEVKTVFKPAKIFGVDATSPMEYSTLYTKAEAIIKYMEKEKEVDLRSIDLSNGALVGGEKLSENIFTFKSGDLVVSVVTNETEVEFEEISEL